MSEYFERFKKALNDRIKKGTVQFDTPNGEKVLMKYGGWIFKSWYVIEPPVIEEEDGSLTMKWNNFIFGGWKNFFKLVGTIAIFALVFLSVDNLIQQYNHIATNPCIISCLGSYVPKNPINYPLVG